MSDEASPPQPGPGWYDNGRGMQRWWDGTKWADQYAPPAPVPQAHFSGLAIAGFVVSIVAVLASNFPNLIGLVAPLAGIVLSIGGWTATQGGRNRGRGLAIAGIVVGGVALLATIGWWVLRLQNGLL